ncbi:MAG: hypothetical protein M1837_006218 [Sclerophora amabilis]|nr:MAG: hypothetical protein M1837_006218 [Sclerophora amabilis]
MSTTLTIPEGYGYVLLTTTSTCFFAYWHGVWSSTYRRSAKVPYPNCYATVEQAQASPTAHAFNCAQRAHANYIENQSSVILATLVAGLKYPTGASVMGLGWLLGRFIYALGYARSPKDSNGKGRMAGVWYQVFQLGLFGMAAKAAWELI